MSTQWRTEVVGVKGFQTSVRTGLDYSVLETVARLEGISIDPPGALLSDLRVMEHAAIAELAKQR